jgi:hypothetical protein
MQNAPYLAWLLETTPGPVRQWLGEEEVVRSLETELHHTIQSRTNLNSAANYSKHCSVPSASDSDYCPREIRLLRDASVLAGIHFYGGDVSRPFVGVYAQTRDLTEDERHKASSHLCAELAVFGPTLA